MELFLREYIAGMVAKRMMMMVEGIGIFLLYKGGKLWGIKRVFFLRLRYFNFRGINQCQGRRATTTRIGCKLTGTI